ncbi:stage II sporulation protein M [Chloroflexota bacterium]
MSYKWWLLIAICLFGVGAGLGIGLAFGVSLSAAIADLLQQNLDAIKELSAAVVPFKVSTAVFIFFKNISALLLSFVFSPFFCFLPILALVLNGGLLSFVSVFMIQEKSLGFLLAGLLPHGIFELPALIIGEAAALSFGAMVIMLLVRKESRNSLISIVKQSSWHVLLTLVLLLITGIFPAIILLAFLREQTRAILLPNLKQNLRYLAIACILLVPAAVIETYITPLFLQ